MNIANVVSLMRGLLAFVLLLLYEVGVINELLAVCAAVMWITDALDGWIARKYGSVPSGKMLDPIMDDAALLIGFAILLKASVVPLWFMAMLVAARLLFSLVRIVGLDQSREFAGSRPITKLSGACLAIGQCLLLAGLGSPNLIIFMMITVLCISMYVFLIHQHGNVLVGLVRKGT